MYIGSGQLAPDLLVKELTKSFLGERKHMWVQNPKAATHERIEVTKQFLVVTWQDGVDGFILACCEVRLPPGAKIAKGTEEWKRYFF